MEKYSWMAFGKGKSRLVIIHLNKPQESGLGGFIRSSMFKDLPIVVDTSSEDERECDFACLAAAKNGVVPRVKMTEEIFYGIKRNEPIARFSLLHEIGHHINGDLSNKDFTSETYDENRVAAVKQGRVLEFELKADAFACSYLGLDYSIKALEQLKAYGDETEQGKLFISEIELREAELFKNKEQLIGVKSRR